MNSNSTAEQTSPEMRPYIPGEDLAGISVSDADTPETGGMIARNPKNHEDEVASLTGKKQHAFQIKSLEGMLPRPIFHIRHHDQFPLVQRWQFRT